MKGPNNSASLKEAKLGRQMSERHFALQMAMTKKQMEEAKVIDFKQPDPASPPTSSSPDLAAAALSERRKSARRFGFTRTTMAGETGSTGLSGATQLGKA